LLSLHIQTTNNMRFKEYLENLNKLAIEKPETLDYTVISSVDDEGNGYNPVIYSPSLGEYDDNEFQSETENFNAICIN